MLSIMVDRREKLPEMAGVENGLSSTVCYTQAFAGLRLTKQAGRVLSAAISSMMNLLYFTAWIKQEPDDIKYKATLAQNSLLFFLFSLY